MLIEYERQQAAADRARYCAPAPDQPSATPEPDLKVVPVDTLKAIIARCEKAMQGIYLGDANLGLDDVYIDVAVAWSHARHALRGTRPNAGQPLSDLNPGLRLVERQAQEPCPGCVERCGQCA